MTLITTTKKYLRMRHTKGQHQMRGFGERTKMKTGFTMPTWSKSFGILSTCCLFFVSPLQSVFLFSAVMTIVVAQQHTRICRPTILSWSASLLFVLVLVQCAIANGSSVAAISSSSLNIIFVPATTQTAREESFSIHLFQVHERTLFII